MRLISRLSDFRAHRTHFDLSKSRSFRAESRVFSKNLGRRAVGRLAHPRFESVSGLDFGISDRPASDDNGCEKSLLGSMIATGSRAGKEKSDKRQALCATTFCGPS